MEWFLSLYIDEIVARHESIRNVTGYEYHLPSTDGQSECTIQTMEDILRACAIYLGGNWDTHLPLSNSHTTIIGIKAIGYREVGFLMSKDPEEEPIENETLMEPIKEG
ncbi:putative reverse transcriptase domain-containing protein [Tanacetum coccineum]